MQSREARIRATFNRQHASRQKVSYERARQAGANTAQKKEQDTLSAKTKALKASQIPWMETQEFPQTSTH